MADGQISLKLKEPSSRILSWHQGTRFQDIVSALNFFLTLTFYIHGTQFLNFFEIINLVYLAQFQHLLVTVVFYSRVCVPFLNYLC